MYSKVDQLHTHTHTHTHIAIFFRLFPHIRYYRILSKVTCAPWVWVLNEFECDFVHMFVSVCVCMYSDTRNKGVFVCF